MRQSNWKLDLDADIWTMLYPVYNDMHGSFIVEVGFLIKALTLVFLDRCIDNDFRVFENWLLYVIFIFIFFDIFLILYNCGHIIFHPNSYVLGFSPKVLCITHFTYLKWYFFNTFFFSLFVWKYLFVIFFVHSKTGLKCIPLYYLVAFLMHSFFFILHSFFLIYSFKE